MSIKALSDYTFVSRYAQHLKNEKRRETWEEAVKRVFDMHRVKYAEQIEKYPKLKEEIDFAENQVIKKRVLGSQRALQYGGYDTLRRNERIFNCSALHMDKPKAFQDVVWLLLAGCGVGFSVQYCHVNKLPKLNKVNLDDTVTYVIPDTCEGWADAIGILLSSYFEHGGYFPEYKGRNIEFDYSKIRPKGSLIANKFKAPGPEPLKNGIAKIRKILNRVAEENRQLKPIEVYDILMHCADFVISAGLRRSATISLFSKEDKEMAKAKTGDWFITNPQRGRSNNSVVLKRDEITRQEFKELFKNIKEFGEPGFIFVSDYQQLTNPCLPGWAKIITKDGLRDLNDIKIGDEIWSKEGWTKVVNKWSTGVKKVYEYKTTAGTFYGTEDHRIVSDGVKVKVGEAESISIITGEYNPEIKYDFQTIMDGIVFGDGSVHKASNDLIYLCIGKDDQDYFESEISEFITRHREELCDYAFEIQTSITAEELSYTYDRSIPARFYYGSRDVVISFLRGLYTANGNICGGRVTLKASSFKVIRQVQDMLSFVGIKSYFTTNKSKKVKFSNGKYECKQSYDLNISTDADKFHQLIGFIQEYKNEKLKNILENKVKRNRKTTYDIIEVNFISEEEVFDITVDNSSHTLWNSCCDVSNCAEIDWIIPETDSENSTVGFCNLCEINGKYCSTKDNFLKACRAASIIGTLQAGYTDFPYLGKDTEDFVREESLLGVSITGWMDNPEILFDKDILEAGAQEVINKNIEIAKLIGINSAARLCTAKPSGHTSCVLGTASGIHPHHARRYIRRVQCNKQEFILNYFKKYNPIAVEESVWSANNTDEVVSFLCEVPAGAITKNQISAIELLEKVKLAQKHWVIAGVNHERNIYPNLSHSVSNTITVKPDEWDDVEEYIYNNRDYFTGISLLPYSGDLDYAQAPFSTVLTPRELVQEYGDASVFASGLIVDGLSAFNNNLWKACDTVLGRGEDLSIEPVKPSYPGKRNNKLLAEYFIQKEIYDEWFAKVDWVRRVNQFADRYFNGDIKRTTYCLKHVSLWKTWCDLKREYKDIDWSLAIEDHEEYQNADEQSAVACHGGACEITF